jgi:hypothetical protein
MVARAEVFMAAVVSQHAFDDDDYLIKFHLSHPSLAHGD